MKLSKFVLVSSFCLLAAAVFGAGRPDHGDSSQSGLAQASSHADSHANLPTLPPAVPTTPPGNSGNAGNSGGAEHSNLPAPADVTACVDSGGNLNVAWCAVPGATKYSIEVEASYDQSLGGGCGEATEEFSFGTNGTSIEIPLSTFDFDFGDPIGVLSACSLDVKVKGLNPPQTHGGRQNNPFTEADENPIDPTVTTCPDLEIPIDPTCPV